LQTALVFFASFPLKFNLYNMHLLLTAFLTTYFQILQKDVTNFFVLRGKYTSTLLKPEDDHIRFDSRSFLDYLWSVGDIFPSSSKRLNIP
jgi:hypothetical protein